MPFEALKGGRKPQHLTTKACNSIRTPGVKSLSYTSKGMITDPKREARLVLRAQSGDREALELVLCNVQASLLRYISGVVGRSGAEDVLQEVFLKICRNLKWLREPELFRPWAYRIASRESFAYLKRERRWANWNGETVDECALLDIDR
jgi:DNA-directed RNA polymerase specialized sigma24 family protein